MFSLRRFLYKAVTLPESGTASDQKLPLFEDTEKAKLLTGYVPSLLSTHCTKHTKLRHASKRLLLIFVFAFAFFSGQSIKDYATLKYKTLLGSNNAHDHVTCSYNASTDKPVSISAPPWAGSPVGADLLSRDGWNFKCSSSKEGHDCKLAFDNDNKTYWQSADDARGHSVEINLTRKFNVHSLAVMPVAVKPTLLFEPVGGSVRKHRVEVATEQGSWDLVALGTWRDSDGGEHTFPSTLAFTEAESADNHCSEICNVRTAFGPVCASYDT